jgi:F0F1-type ATP synthase epsilon subunit
MSSPKKVQSDSMTVKVYAPFKVYFDGPASSLTAVNRVGQFDILPNHHNFISLLEPGDVTVRAPSQPDFKLPINRGVIHVKADEVKVFLDA